MGDLCRISQLHGVDDELMSGAEVKVCELRKSYGKAEAVSGISFKLCKGQMTALLGPNGAGKSTVINILSTAVRKYHGSITMGGEDMRKAGRRIRKKIGVVFQNSILDEQLTVGENLRVRGGFYGLRGKELQKRVYETAKLTGTEELLNRYYGSLSGGQKRRCDIARAMLHSPELLLLDEPTSALDPDIRRVVWETVNAVRAATGLTVMTTTHYMEEAALADHIIVMKEGSIAFDGTPYEMKLRFAKDMLILYCGMSWTRIYVSDSAEALKILEERRGRYDSFEMKRGSMHDAYMSLICGKAGEYREGEQHG